jgi:hypothetical protein
MPAATLCTTERCHYLADITAVFTFPAICSNEDEDAEAPSLQEDLGWASAVGSVADVAVPEGAELKQAGCIMSLLEGMVVVQGLANSRALDSG